MSIPGYDFWKLQGPHDGECEKCGGSGRTDCMNCGGDGEVADDIECPLCDGTGKVECSCREGPDCDDLYDRARDERMEQ